MVITTSPLVKTYTLQEFWNLPEPADRAKLELSKSGEGQNRQDRLAHAHLRIGGAEIKASAECDTARAMRTGGPGPTIRCS